MHASTPQAHDAFAPPPPPGRARAIGLALLAHGLLIAALAWGVNWKTSADQDAVEAELWSAVPQQAAPPKPRPEPKPEPLPTPPAPPPRPVRDDAREADIALQQQRLAEEKKRQAQQLEQERKDKEKRERLAQEKKEKQEKAQREKELREKQLAEQKKREQEKAEQDKQKKLAEEKRRTEAEEKRAEELRQDQLRRIAGLAGAAGGASASGSAQQSSGPSAGYGGKVAARVRPNIVYPDIAAGNPRAEVEVRAAPDGSITAVRLTQSSGHKAWDEAVVRALYKTETLPRDTDGRVPSSLVIGFRPKD